MRENKILKKKKKKRILGNVIEKIRMKRFKKGKELK